MSMNPDPEFLNYIVTYRRGPLVGNLLNVLLYGILTVQTYFYYIAFPDDKKITKAIVAFVYSIDTAQTIVALYDFYQSFCINGDPFVLDNTAHQWLTIPLSSTLIATVAQLYYGWGSVGGVCDLVIAIYMSWFLTKQMRRSSRTTQVLVTRIKRLVLETGFLTAAFAATFAVLLDLFGSSAVFAVPGLTLGKIYSNSILVLLNNRFTITGGRNEPAFEFEADSYHLSDLPRREGAEHGIRE